MISVVFFKNNYNSLDLLHSQKSGSISVDMSDDLSESIFQGDFIEDSSSFDVADSISSSDSGISSKWKTQFPSNSNLRPIEHSDLDDINSASDLGTLKASCIYLLESSLSDIESTLYSTKQKLQILDVNFFSFFTFLFVFFFKYCKYLKKIRAFYKKHRTQKISYILNALLKRQNTEYNSIDIFPAKHG
jgi:hypothetical protein